MNNSDISDEDFVLCEIGGTVGDIESLPFLEAIRQLGNELGQDRTMYIHLTLIPFIAAAGELKTKPTQPSVKELLNVGIQADLLLCRSDRNIPEADRKKVALFCNVREEAVVPALDVDSIYKVPIVYHEQGLDRQVCEHFSLENTTEPDLKPWQDIVKLATKPEGEVSIAVVGKYTGLKDAYKSLTEALAHGGIANNVCVNLKWLESDTFEDNEAIQNLEGVNGILIPGGFGERGAEGKIRAAKYARERRVPYFGICFGMQMAVVEAARNLAGIKNAGTTEFGPCSEPVVGLMTEWERHGVLHKRDHISDKGGTMRLGAYPCELKDSSRVKEIYGLTTISERHRHRYEVNIAYEDQLAEVGVHCSGKSPDGTLPEIIEIPDHPWFIGVQFHPELKSRPFQPHPLFIDFVSAAVKQSRLV